MRKVPRILCERYELMDVLGKGAHGRIYLATDLVTHDRVAIKLVSNAEDDLLDGEIIEEQIQILARDQLNERYDETSQEEASAGGLHPLPRP